MRHRGKEHNGKRIPRHKNKVRRIVPRPAPARTRKQLAKRIDDLLIEMHVAADGHQAERGVAEQGRAHEAAKLTAESGARAAAETATRDKHAYLSVLTHEMSDSLGAICLWCEHLADTTAARPQELGSGLEIIARTARFASVMADNILAANQLHLAELRLDRQPVDLGGIVDTVVAATAPLAQAFDITVRKALFARAVVISGDAPCLEQIVWSLMNNAIKVTRPGGSVEITLEQTNSHAELTVCDDGAGISPAHLPAVFEPLSDSNSPLAFDRVGPRISLHIVKTLVELHAGSIRVQSPGMGLGTSFVVAFPVSGAAHERSPADHGCANDPWLCG
jgi:two-component system CheB/CheR fusion protein